LWLNNRIVTERLEGTKRLAERLTVVVHYVHVNFSFHFFFYILLIRNFQKIVEVWEMDRGIDFTPNIKILY
jgi:hypothetical protein